MRTAHRWKAVTERSHEWQMPKCGKMGMCVSANAVSMPEKNLHRRVWNRDVYVHSC